MSVNYFDDDYPQFVSGRKRRDSGGFDDDDSSFDFETYHAPEFDDNDDDDDESFSRSRGMPIRNRLSADDFDDDAEMEPPTRPPARGSVDFDDNDSEESADPNEFHYAGSDFDDGLPDNDEDLAAYNASKWTGAHRNRMNDPDYVEQHRDAFLAMESGGNSSRSTSASEAKPGLLADAKVKVGEASGSVGNILSRAGRALASESRTGDGAGYKALGMGAAMAKLPGVGSMTGVGSGTINNIGMMAQAAGNLLGSTRMKSTDDQSRAANQALDAAKVESQRALESANAVSDARAPVWDRGRARVNFLKKSLKTGKAAQDVGVEPITQSTMKQTAGAMNTKVARDAGQEASYIAGRQKWQEKTGENLTPFKRPDVSIGDWLGGHTQNIISTTAKIGAGALGQGVSQEDIRLGNNKTAIAQAAAGLATGATFAKDMVQGTLGDDAGFLASAPSKIVGAVPTLTGMVPTGGGKNLQDRLDQLQMQEDFDRQWGSADEKPLAQKIAESGFLPRPQAFSPDAKLAPNMKYDKESRNIVAGGVAAGIPALGLSSGRPYVAETGMDVAQGFSKPVEYLAEHGTGQSMGSDYTKRLLGRSHSGKPGSLLQKAGGLVPGYLRSALSELGVGLAGDVQANIRAKAFEELPGTDAGMGADEVATSKGERRAASQAGYTPALPGVGMSPEEMAQWTTERAANSSAGYRPRSPVRDASYLFDDDEAPTPSVAPESDSESFEFPEAGLSEGEAMAAKAERRAASQAGYTPAARATGNRMGTALNQTPDFQDEPNELERAIAATEGGDQAPAAPSARMAVEPGRGLLPFTSSPFIPRANPTPTAPKRRGGFLGRISNFFGRLFGRKNR